ncbi:MAG: DUF3575 domain-containing protein [Bacteroidetes bacterium]|nr:DUF3575 domain-containing protein [Bacteroidota bacterium]
MKKYLFFLLFAAPSLWSQSVLEKKHNEFRVELVSAIASSKANLTYERFFSRRFSSGLTMSYANSKKVNDDFDEGNRNTIPKYEVIPFVRYNLSNGQRSFYFAEVFLSANGGDFRETVLKTDNLGHDYYTIEKSKYSDVAAGAGAGYKYYIKDKFGIEFLVGFGSNMFNKDKSPDIISRVGLSFGYRF